MNKEAMMGKERWRKEGRGGWKREGEGQVKHINKEARTEKGRRR